jgi:hypothetical protein
MLHALPPHAALRRRQAIYGTCAQTGAYARETRGKMRCASNEGAGLSWFYEKAPERPENQATALNRWERKRVEVLPFTESAMWLFASAAR